MLAIHELILKIEQDIRDYLNYNKTEIDEFQDFGLPLLTGSSGDELKAEQEKAAKAEAALQKANKALLELQMAKDNLQKAHDLLKDAFTKKMEQWSATDFLNRSFRDQNEDLRRQVKAMTIALEKIG